MDFIFLILSIALLLIFGYAQLQKGVVKTSGKIKLNDEEEIEVH